MAHYQATIEYDGTAFFGFQRQAAARTVQGAVERALHPLAGGTRVRVRGAGRTDRGVHATGQVIDFRLDWRKDDAALLRALNALLPDDVAVRAVGPAPDGFHPRYDAVSRAYVYTVLNAPQRQPLLRHVTLHEPRPLDAAAMDAAVQPLLGEHDFASFGRATTVSGSTVRALRAARVWREGELVRVGLEANGFLYRMVRSLVGALLVVGRGEMGGGWLRTVLEARDRGAAGQVAAPMGLCLVAVRYPGAAVGSPFPQN